MPIVTEDPTRAYAHCRNARCPGYAQEEINAVREETAFTFGDLGGDGVFTHMTERSTVGFRFADPVDGPCPGCGEVREVTGDPRPTYQPLSGKDPMGLLHAQPYNPSQVVPAEDKTAELQAEVAAMREQMAELLKGKE